MNWRTAFAAALRAFRTDHGRFPRVSELRSILGAL